VQVSTALGIAREDVHVLCHQRGRYSVCLLYWYKSTNTDAASTCSAINAAGIQYALSCDAGTVTSLANKLANLMPDVHVLCHHAAGTQFTCFTGTKIQILTLHQRGGVMAKLVLKADAALC
jgi:hypothetical protein